jgi:hypothetical protein
MLTNISYSIKLCTWRNVFQPFQCFQLSLCVKKPSCCVMKLSVCVMKLSVCVMKLSFCVSFGSFAFLPLRLNLLARHFKNVVLTMINNLHVEPIVIKKWTVSEYLGKYSVPNPGHLLHGYLLHGHLLHTGRTFTLQKVMEQTWSKCPPSVEQKYHWSKCPPLFMEQMSTELMAVEQISADQCLGFGTLYFPKCSLTVNFLMSDI